MSCERFDVGCSTKVARITPHDDGGLSRWGSSRFSPAPVRPFSFLNSAVAYCAGYKNHSGFELSSDSWVL
jgi:hypothetical protein